MQDSLNYSVAGRRKICLPAEYFQQVPRCHCRYRLHSGTFRARSSTTIGLNWTRKEMPYSLTKSRLCRCQHLGSLASPSPAPKRGLGGFAYSTTAVPRWQRSRPCTPLRSKGVLPTFQRQKLAHINQHAQKRNSSGSSNVAKVICSTREHSPGHNVATISISNPAKLNIVSSPVLHELIDTCEKLSKDHNLRAVVLTGAPTAAGKAASFIGGADISEMSKMSSYEEAKNFITLVHNACAALRDIIPVPVIARIHGFCLGAGLEVAASCDLRIATKDSLLGMPEVKIGLPSVVEAAYLPGLMGWGRSATLHIHSRAVEADFNVQSTKVLVPCGKHLRHHG